MPLSGAGRAGSGTEASWSSVFGSNILSTGPGSTGVAQTEISRPRLSNDCETQSPIGSGDELDVITGFLPSGPARRKVSVCHESSWVDDTSFGAMNGFWGVAGTPLIGLGLAGLPTYDGSVVAGPGAIGVAALAA